MSNALATEGLFIQRRPESQSIEARRQIAKVRLNSREMQLLEEIADYHSLKAAALIRHLIKREHAAMMASEHALDGLEARDFVMLSVLDDTPQGSTGIAIELALRGHPFHASRTWSAKHLRKLCRLGYVVKTSRGYRLDTKGERARATLVDGRPRRKPRTKDQHRIRRH